jgi:hypothetical protein
MYYVVMSSPRYRYPILWLSLLPAGYFVQWLGSILAPVFKGLSPLRNWGRVEKAS